jgi:ribosome-binding protein aMBF1 (putative translation factor)
VITGTQIRKARLVLRWEARTLAARARVPVSLVKRAERADGEAVITVAHEAAIRRALEVAGVEFTEGGNEPVVRLKAKGTI